MLVMLQQILECRGGSATLCNLTEQNGSIWLLQTGIFLPHQPFLSCNCVGWSLPLPYKKELKK